MFKNLLIEQMFVKRTLLFLEKLLLIHGLFSLLWGPWTSMSAQSPLCRAAEGTSASWGLSQTSFWKPGWSLSSLQRQDAAHSALPAVLEKWLNE